MRKLKRTLLNLVGRIRKIRLEPIDNKVCYPRVLNLEEWTTENLLALEVEQCDLADNISRIVFQAQLPPRMALVHPHIAQYAHNVIDSAFIVLC